MKTKEEKFKEELKKFSGSGNFSITLEDIMWSGSCITDAQKAERKRELFEKKLKRIIK